ncbi:MAG: uroporphyrinogen decarboxylase family protein [Promethearchaeota archaeon]
MKKSDRIRLVIDGEPVDRIPFVLWRHLPPEDATPEGLFNATVRFIRRWDLDFIKVMFRNQCWTADWGTKFAPYDRGGGFFPISEYVIKHPSDWKKLRPLNPRHGLLGEQLKVVEMLRQELGPDMPIVATIFSPLTVGIELAGPSVHKNALTHQENVHAGLKVICETVSDFAQACMEAGADGIFLAVQSATHDALPLNAFAEFGPPYDLPILERIVSKAWFNILHLCKPNLRFEVVKNYPVQAVNWHDRGFTGPSLQKAREVFSGVLIGGIDNEAGGCFVNGSPEEAAAQARDAIEQVESNRFILGPGCVMNLATPEANIDAVRQVIGEDDLA